MFEGAARIGAVAASCKFPNCRCRSFALISDRAHRLGYDDFVDRLQGHRWLWRCRICCRREASRGIGQPFICTCGGRRGRHSRGEDGDDAVPDDSEIAEALQWCTVPSLRADSGYLWIRQPLALALDECRLGGAACILWLVTLVINFGKAAEFEFAGSHRCSASSFSAKTLRCRRVCESVDTAGGN